MYPWHPPLLAPSLTPFPDLPLNLMHKQEANEFGKAILFIERTINSKWSLQTIHVLKKT